MERRMDRLARTGQALQEQMAAADQSDHEALTAMTAKLRGGPRRDGRADGLSPGGRGRENRGGPIPRGPLTRT